MTKHGFTASIDKQTSHLRTVLLEAVEEAYDTGYREALRDVLAAFDAHSNVGNWIDRDVLVRMLAAERGIDLTESEAQ